MPRAGYWKFYRKIWDWPYAKRPAYLSVWCWLISEAAFKNKKSVLFHKKQVYLKPGQLTCGAYQIQRGTGVKRGTVERILKTLKNEEQIDKQTDRHCSIITILNWDRYQINEEQIEEQVRNTRGTGEEQVRTTEECKNDKNDKNIILAPSNDVADPINQIFKVFYDTINPAINYANKASRSSAKWLIDKYGLDKTIKTAQYACSLYGVQYAPQITTPYQLKEKLSALKGYYDSQHNKQTKEKKGITL